MVCALLRLARFNVENSPDPDSHKRFKGLPSPAAAGCVASLGILCGQPSDNTGVWHRALVENAAILSVEDVRRFVEAFAPVGGLAVGLLMVSPINYPHVTNQFLRGRKPFGRLMQVILAGFVIFLIRELAIVLIFWGYTLFFVGLAAWRQLRPTPPPPPPAGATLPLTPVDPSRDPSKWPVDVHRNN